MLSFFEHVPVDGLGDYEQAAAVQGACRRGGETVRSLFDCLIAAVALREGIAVLPTTVTSTSSPVTPRWSWHSQATDLRRTFVDVGAAAIEYASVIRVGRCCAGARSRFACSPSSAYTARFQLPSRRSRYSSERWRYWWSCSVKHMTSWTPPRRAAAIASRDVEPLEDRSL